MPKPVLLATYSTNGNEGISKCMPAAAVVVDAIIVIDAGGEHRTTVQATINDCQLSARGCSEADISARRLGGRASGQP